MITTLPADRLDEARALRIELHRHHSAVTVPPGFLPRDEDTAWSGWRTKAESILRAGAGELFLHAADASAEPDGLALVVLLPSAELVRPVLEPVGDHAELLTLVVSDANRGHGVGAQLYERAAEWARSRGAGAMHIDTRADNHDGFRFYVRQGAHPAFTQLVQAL